MSTEVLLLLVLLVVGVVLSAALVTAVYKEIKRQKHDKAQAQPTEPM